MVSTRERARKSMRVSAVGRNDDDAADDADAEPEEEGRMVDELDMYVVSVCAPVLDADPESGAGRGGASCGGFDRVIRKFESTANLWSRNFSARDTVARAELVYCSRRSNSYSTSGRRRFISCWSSLFWVPRSVTLPAAPTSRSSPRGRFPRTDWMRVQPRRNSSGIEASAGFHISSRSSSAELAGSSLGASTFLLSCSSRAW